MGTDPENKVTTTHTGLLLSLDYEPESKDEQAQESRKVQHNMDLLGTKKKITEKGQSSKNNYSQVENNSARQEICYNPVKGWRGPTE